MKKTIYSLLFAFAFTAGYAIQAQQKEPPATGNVQEAAKEFVELLLKEDFSGAARNFDGTMRGALPPAKLQDTWKSLKAQVGLFKRQVGFRIERVQQYDIAFVTCEFEKATLDVKVVFDSARQIAGLFFVPSQSPPKLEAPASPAMDTLREKEVRVGVGGWAVHGTLSLPKGPGPFPALVLVHGSGPHDRDETIGPNKPFRDLSDGLVSKGIAVLRYEKRTKEHASQLAPLKDSITTKEETTEDALLAVSLLRKTERIDPKKIFVLGHSLGGMLIPRIGNLDPSIVGLIVMAGTSRPLEDVILDQMSYILSLDGTISETEKSQLNEIKSQVARVKDPTLSAATASTDLPLGIPAKYWLDLRGYNPPEVARSVKQPMLILQGERDYQVTMEDLAGWKKYLSSKPNVEFKTYPKLNHLFIEGEGKGMPQEYNVAGHVAEIVIEDIAAWMKKQ
jgi:dienelactone hydrolase